MKALISILILTLSFSESLTENRFFITQNKKVISLNSSSVRLKKSRFKIRFHSKEYNSPQGAYFSTRIAFLRSEKDYELAKVGVRLEDVLYFSGGTGMAPSKSGEYKSFSINSEKYPAHHYIIFSKSDTLSQRAKLIKDSNGDLDLEVSVDEFVSMHKKINISKVDFGKVYFVLVNDANRNGWIDKGELAKTILTFN